MQHFTQILGEEERRFLAYPERLRDIVAPLKKGEVIIINEIQRVPQLLPQIHALIEEKRGIQYVMTGSSARKLRRTVSDLLGGKGLSATNGAIRKTSGY